MELDRSAAVAALKQLLECCDSAEKVVRYSGRDYSAKFSEVEFRDAQINALARYAKYADPLEQAIKAIQAAGFEIPKVAWPRGPITRSWLSEGDNAWVVKLSLAPTIQVNHNAKTPFTIHESWPSLEAILALSKKISTTINELAHQSARLTKNTASSRKMPVPRFRPGPCPHCGKEKVVTTSTEKDFRKLKCRACGHTFTRARV